MTFRLKITLGNEAMLTPTDVGHALRETGVKLIRNEREHFEPDSAGRIVDLNGNVVGEWKVGR